MDGKIIMIRGKEYRQFDYDWYMDKALELAPRQWNYDWVLRLRDAIRENYQHAHNIELDHLAKKARPLKAFIRAIEIIESPEYWLNIAGGKGPWI
jgi:hypothetical protein